MNKKIYTLILLVLFIVFSEILIPSHLFAHISQNIWKILAALSWLVYGILPGIQNLFAGEQDD